MNSNKKEKVKKKKKAKNPNGEKIRRKGKKTHNCLKNSLAATTQS